MTAHPQANVSAPAPGLVGSREGQVVRLIVYAMLVLNAATAVLFGDRLWQAWRDGYLPVWAPLLLPGAFTAFVVVYTVDRWLLVRRHRYPLSRALFQVAFALVFLTLLLPQQASELKQLKQQETGASEPALLLLMHPDDAVRAATCAMLSGRYGQTVYGKVQQLAQGDASAQVRAGCASALTRLHLESK